MADDAAAAPPIRILHLEDSEIDHQLVALTLRRHGMACSLARVETLDEFARALAGPPWSLILADYHLGGFTALDAWALSRAQEHRPPFVLLSGAIGETVAVEAIRLGFSDYVLKDHIGQLPHVIERALEVWQARRDKARAHAELAESERRLAALAEHLQTSIEQERAAIAREVHDDIGGSLAAIRLDLAWIARHSQGDAAMQSHVAAAADMLQHALSASQRIMMNLRPPILDQGLVAAIGWLAEAFERRTGVATTVRAARERIEVDKQLALVAYRTAQEALTNAAKYAGCSRVTIELSDAEGVLTLEVSDDGCGLAPGALAKPRSFGLRGLAERARTVDGWLDVSSQPGRGTTVILSIPLHAEAAERVAAGEAE
ncbi:ATP-binding protein [Pseudorhodoferax sp.]|uniref:hybrid sensor histidine kinase/response regulator n=1 Tax=Pseudorhodoferax sp. TaxID=1993553 RepID=UPI0039E42CDE